ncbi:MAG: FkbM family methyltransferase [bacterium]
MVLLKEKDRINGLWFIKSSILLDILFLITSNWELRKKLEFIYKKYWEIFLLISGIKKFEFGKNFVNLFGNKIFYDSPYGIAGYQSMLARQQGMFKSIGLKDVKTIVDIGANVGFFSMMLRELYPDSKIYAVEPVPKIFENLEKNLNFSQDNVFNMAMSDKCGFVKMIFDERKSAFSHVINSKGCKKRGDTGEIVTVSSITLEKFCKQNSINFIDVLKIDTEGFEANVLRGAKNILSKTRYLHIEISLENDTKYTFSEINSLLYSNNYNFQLLFYRNFSGKGYGTITVGEFLYKNINLT